MYMYHVPDYRSTRSRAVRALTLPRLAHSLYAHTPCTLVLATADKKVISFRGVWDPLDAKMGAAFGAVMAAKASK